MFWMKACQKCRGDLYRGEDSFGGYIACMQCGKHLPPADEARLIFDSSILSHQWSNLFQELTLAV